MSKVNRDEGEAEGEGEKKIEALPHRNGGCQRRKDVSDSIEQMRTRTSEERGGVKIDPSLIFVSLTFEPPSSQKPSSVVQDPLKRPYLCNTAYFRHSLETSAG